MSTVNRRQFLKKSLVGGLGLFAIPSLTAMGPKSKPSRTLSSSPATDSMQMVGYAERDITPEIGMERFGNYMKTYLHSIHDPCKIRATVFGDGPDRIAIIGIDAGMIPRHTVLSARETIRQRCGISPEAVMMGASHNHSAGPVGMVQPGQYDHASKLVQKLAYEKSSCANPEYLRDVEQAIVEGICEADKTREKSHCGVGVGVADQVAFNRRFHRKNGLTYTYATSFATSPHRESHDIVNPAGPTDPEVGVIGTWNQAGKLTGCIVNFACHATANPGGVSANYIYYIEKTIRGLFGPEVIVVFVNGANGDVEPYDYSTPYKKFERSGERAAQIAGTRIGAEAVKVLLSMERGQLLPIGARHKVLDIQRRAPRPERVKESYDIVKKGPEKEGATRWRFAKETLMLDAKLDKWPTAKAEIQAVQIGPVAFLSVPVEYFCAYGLELKAKNSFLYTFPVSLANADLGYVPTEEAFGKHGGGYETRLTSYTNLEPAAGRQMLEALLELSSNMEPGEVPKPSVVPDKYFGTWSYGDVPPELGMWEFQ